MGFFKEWLCEFGKLTALQKSEHVAIVLIPILLFLSPIRRYFSMQSLRTAYDSLLNVGLGAWLRFNRRILMTNDSVDWTLRDGLFTAWVTVTNNTRQLIVLKRILCNRGFEVQVSDFGDTPPRMLLLVDDRASSVLPNGGQIRFRCFVRPQNISFQHSMRMKVSYELRKEHKWEWQVFSAIPLRIG